MQFGGVNAVNYTVNSSSQITAVAPAGSSTIDVAVTNPAGASATAGTSNDYTYAAPAVTSVVINGGDIVARDRFNLAPNLAGQQSVVEQILVTFNMPVTLDADAFTVTSLAASVSAMGIAPSTATIAVTATGVVGAGSDSTGYTQFILTFNAGDGVNSFDNRIKPAQGNAFTTLADGFYQLNTIGSKVHAGVSDTAADRADTFWALYGAANAGDVKVTSPLGDGNDTLFVDGLALNDVYSAFGSSANTGGPPAYSAPFDWNLDGFVDGIDLTHLYTNFGTIWKF